MTAAKCMHNGPFVLYGAFSVLWCGACGAVGIDEESSAGHVVKLRKGMEHEGVPHESVPGAYQWFFPVSPGGLGASPPDRPKAVAQGEATEHASAIGATTPAQGPKEASPPSSPLRATSAVEPDVFDRLMAAVALERAANDLLQLAESMRSVDAAQGVMSRAVGYMRVVEWLAPDMPRRGLGMRGGR